MAFVGVEFEEEDQENSIALVSSTWFTPKKKEVFWPPYKSQNRYYKSLREFENPDENSWKLHKIKRSFFETGKTDRDDYNKALQKLRCLEDTSDIQTDVDETVQHSNVKRIIQRPKRYSVSDDDDTADEDGNIPKRSCLPRPPIIKATNLSSESSGITENALLPRLNKNKQINSQSFDFSQSSGSVGSRCNTPSSVISTPNSSRYSLGLDSQVVTFLAAIKEQNTEILKLLKRESRAIVTSGNILPENLPVQLPINTEAELNTLEEFLQDKVNSGNLCSHLSSLGGRDVASQTNKILRYVMTDHLATSYSFKGSRNNKRAFGALSINSVIVRAVKLTTNGITTKTVEDHIKIWLKHAPSRLKKANKD